MKIRWAVRIDTGIVGVDNPSLGFLGGTFKWITGPANLVLPFSNIWYSGIILEEGIAFRRSADISQAGNISTGNTAEVHAANAQNLDAFLLDHSIYLFGKEIQIFRVLDDDTFVREYWGVIDQKEVGDLDYTISAQDIFQKVLRRIPRKAGVSVALGAVSGSPASGAFVESPGPLLSRPVGNGAQAVDRAPILSYWVPDMSPLGGDLFGGKRPWILVDSGSLHHAQNSLTGKWVEVVDGTGAGWRARIIGNHETGTPVFPGILGALSPANSTRLFLARTAGDQGLYFIGGGFPEANAKPPLLGAWDWVRGEPYYGVPVPFPFRSSRETLENGGGGQEITIPFSLDAADGVTMASNVPAGTDGKHYDSAFPIPGTWLRDASFVRLVEPDAHLVLGAPGVTSVSSLDGFPVDGWRLAFDPSGPSVRVHPGTVEGEGKVALKESLASSGVVSVSVTQDRTYGENWRGSDFAFAPAFALPTAAGPYYDFVDAPFGPVDWQALRTPANISTQVPRVSGGKLWINTPWKDEDTLKGVSGKIGHQVGFRLTAPSGVLLKDALAKYDEIRLQVAGNVTLYGYLGRTEDLPAMDEGASIDYIRKWWKVHAFQVRPHIYLITRNGNRILVGGNGVLANLGALCAMGVPSRVEPIPGFYYWKTDLPFGAVDPEYWTEDWNGMADLGPALREALDLSDLLVKREDLVAVEVQITLEFHALMNESGLFKSAVSWNESRDAFYDYSLSQLDLVGVKVSDIERATWVGTGGTEAQKTIPDAIRELSLGNDDTTAGDFLSADWDRTFSRPFVRALFSSVSDSADAFQNFLRLASFGMFTNPDRKIRIRDWLSARDGATDWGFGMPGGLPVVEGSVRTIQQSPVNEIYNEITLKSAWDYSTEAFGMEFHADGTLPAPFPLVSDRPETETISFAFANLDAGTGGALVQFVFYPSDIPNGVEVGDVLTWTATGGGRYGAFSGIIATLQSDGIGGTVATLADRIPLDGVGDYTIPGATPGTLRRDFGTPSWVEYVQGLADYNSAQRIWTRLSAAFVRSGTARNLELSDKFLASEADAVAYLDFLTRWATFQKNRITFATRFVGTGRFDLLDYVAFADEWRTGGEVWYGWIVGIRPDTKRDLVELEVLFDIDPREACLDQVWDEGEGTIIPAEFLEVTEGAGDIDPAEYPEVDEQFQFDCNG